uniref:WSSV063 n=1 Tax=White spot syndrome virus TaxID=342409 RepID=A0A3G5BHR7_9VIRU|nr:WSSV063 [White spot syndrome virus]
MAPYPEVHPPNLTFSRPSGPPSKLDRAEKFFEKFLRWRMRKIL